MSLLDQFGEELQEEGDDQKSDVHTVDISIRGHNDLVISEGVESFLDIEGCLQEIELLVLVDHLFGQSERVQRFASKREHGLSVHIAALGDASAGRITLGNEDTRLFLPVVLGIAIVDAAVTELTVVEVGLLGTLTGQLGHTRHRLTLPFALLDLIFQDLCHVSMDMQVVVHLLLDKVAHIFINADPVGSHGQGAQLDLRLTLEHRFLHIDGNGGHNTCADVSILVFVEELLDGTGDMLFKGTLVGTSLSGMLTIDEGIILLTILVRVCEGNLNVLTLQMDNGIEPVIGHTVAEQILQSMSGENATAVVHDGQSGVQIGIVAKHVFHDFIVKGVIQEQRIVGFEMNIGTILILRVLRLVADHFTTFEDGHTHLTITVATHLKVAAQRIDGLHADTIQTNRLLKGLGVVLTASVQHRDRLDHLSLGDATTIVAHRHPQVLIDRHLNTVTGLHLELIDGVVDDFLQQHIDTIFRQGAIAQATDIHTRTGTYMLHVTQMADILVIILYRLVRLINEVVVFYHSCFL